MVELTVVPIAYPVSELEDVAESLSRAYGRIFSSVRLADPISAYDLPSKILLNEDLNWHTALSDPLLDYLTPFGQNVLAVTSLQVIHAGPLVDVPSYFTSLAEKGEKMHQYVTRYFGNSNPVIRTAFVSTFKPAMGSVHSAYQIGRVSAIGVHEAGHFFGLAHHEDRSSVSGPGKCAMSIDDSKLFDRYRLSRKICDLDPSFCEPCYESLGVSLPILSLVRKVG